MPRPRKPTRILELTGRLKHNRKRYAGRQAEPVDNDPLGDPPERLAKSLRALWTELAGSLVPGVALASDRPAFECLVRLVGRDRRGDLSPGDRAHMLRLLMAFGMTPADRSRVAAPARRPAGNPFSSLG